MVAGYFQYLMSNLENHKWKYEPRSKSVSYNTNYDTLENTHI